MRCRAVSGTKMPSLRLVLSVKNRKRTRNWSTATAKTNSTNWMQQKRNGFVSKGKWRNWKGRWPSPEGTSIPLHTEMAVEHPMVEEVAQRKVEEVLQPQKAIPHRMTSPVTWRKSNAEVTSARRPLKADWVSVALTGMSWLRNKGLIPSPKSVRPKRSAIVPNLSSNLVIPMRRSFIR